MFQPANGPRTLAVALAVLVPGLLAACGGGTGPYGSEDTDPSGDASGSASATTIDMTSSSSGGYGGSGGTSFDFSPEVDTVSAGDTVTWSNGTSAVHTVDADDGSWSSGDVSENGSYTRVFTETGRHPYHCAYHGSAGSDMHGTIVVQ